MSSSWNRRRARGRWKAALLLSASLMMPSQVAVPVQAQELGPNVVLPVLGPPLITKQKSASHHKKKKKRKKPESIEEMIRDEFGSRADEALRIAFCESRFNAKDVSSAGAVGVFQIRPSDHGWRVKKVKHGKDLFDPLTNVRVAHHIYEHQGWRPWVCARIVGLSSRRSRRYSAVRNGTVDTWSPNEGSRRPREPRQPGGGTMSAWP